VNAARPTRTAALVLALLVAAVGCTHDAKPAAHGSPSPSPSPSASTAPAPASVPLTVKVTRVHGRLSEKSVSSLEGNVHKTIAAYVAGAFLGGSYPRSDFKAAFSSFTPGVRTRAARDTTLLTNATYGGSTESVRTTHGTAYLSVLSPYKVAAGITANVDLVFRVERKDRPAERVRLRGRLLLTRNKANGWSIFGYDLARSDTPVGSSS
jgi:hypothetical protein